MTSTEAISFCSLMRWFNRAEKNIQAAWHGRVYDIQISSKERFGRGVLGVGEYLFPFNCLIYAADKNIFTECLTHRLRKVEKLEDTVITNLQERSLVQLMQPQPLEVAPEEKESVLVKEVVEEFQPLQQVVKREVEKENSRVYLYALAAVLVTGTFYWLSRKEALPTKTVVPVSCPPPQQMPPPRVEVIKEVIIKEIMLPPELPPPAPPCPPPVTIRLYEKVIVPEKVVITEKMIVLEKDDGQEKPMPSNSTQPSCPRFETFSPPQPVSNQTLQTEEHWTDRDGVMTMAFAIGNAILVKILTTFHQKV